MIGGDLSGMVDAVVEFIFDSENNIQSAYIYLYMVVNCELTLYECVCRYNRCGFFIK